ncbi:MAG TPA: hypothetical protein VGN17_04920 [Bryobacteraceae bacterium]|jgi:hypothetical protein
MNIHLQSALIAVAFVGGMVALLLYLNTRHISDPGAVWLVWALVVGVGVAIWRDRKQHAL